MSIIYSWTRQNRLSILIKSAPVIIETVDFLTTWLRNPIKLFQHYWSIVCRNTRAGLRHKGPVKDYIKDTLFSLLYTKKWFHKQHARPLLNNSSLPLARNICVSESGQHCSRYWLVAYSAPSHYLNQYWVIVNWTLKNKLQWNFSNKSNFFI